MPEDEGGEPDAGRLDGQGKRVGMMRFKPVLLWARQNLILALTGIGYILCIAFILNEIMERDLWPDGQEADPLDFKTVMMVICMMASLGFLMLTMMVGSMLNLYRLHKSEQRASQILSHQMKAVEASMDGIAILDAQGNYTYMNKAHAVCYGYDGPEDLIGRNWRQLYTPMTSILFEREILPVLQDTGSWQGQPSAVKRDGSSFPHEVTLNSLDDGGMICIVRDLTEKAEDDRLMHMIKLAIEAAEDGIAITDHDNKLLFMNRSFLKIHGYDPYDREQYIGTDWRLLYNSVGQEQINSIVLPTTILKGTWNGSLTVMKRDGVLFYGDASLTRLPNGLTLGVMRDISDRRKAELEREELRDQLFQSQKIEAVGRLTSGIVSDFSQILRTISMAADVFMAENVAPEAHREYAIKIHEATGKANDLVDQLLSFSHKKNIKAGPVNIAQCVVGIRAALTAAIPHNVDYITDIREPDACTFASPGQIEQIITNLSLNAIDAVGRKRGKVAVILKDIDRNLFGLRRHMIVDDVPDKMKSTTVRMKAGQDKYFLMSGFLVKGRDYVQMTVSDSGQGIMPDILPNVFDPFFTTKLSQKGAGLGLSTVQGIVTSGSGAIIIETVPGEGTNIHLFFLKSEVLEGGPVLQAA